MAQIPAGEFWMGRVHMFLIDELGMYLRPRIDDLPSHLVHIDAFYIDKYEATNSDYKKFVEATSHRKPFHWKNGQMPEGKESYPVYNVSWDDADAYCKWAGKRLPTEAEWEKAARGGLDKAFYAWGDEFMPGAVRGGGRGGGEGEAAVPGGSYSNSQQGGKKMAHYGMPNGAVKVGSFPPNGYGLYDMIGNVAEWMSDWYEKNYYVVSPDSNPKGPDSGMYRSIRGSSWSETDERSLGVHYRNYTTPSLRTNVLGFRCAKTP